MGILLVGLSSLPIENTEVLHNKLVHRVAPLCD
jgi:hypothetical protein